MNLTENFKLSEFECNCGCETPKEVLYNLQKVANQLQTLRNYTGKSITINSGYRCPEYNTKIGGVSKSQHILGTASDIVVKGMTPVEVTEIIEKLILDGEMLQGGIGIYSSFVHYDIRKTRARWDFSNK